jgi:hypothetical protein
MPAQTSVTVEIPLTVYNEVTTGLLTATTAVQEVVQDPWWDTVVHFFQTLFL